MNNQSKTTQTTISKKYPKLSQYEELSDINLAVVAGGSMLINKLENLKNPNEASVKGA